MNFQKIISVLLCGCFLLGTGVASVSVGAASEKTYSLAEHTDKYKTQGRTSISGGELLVDWSASGIEFEADCSGDVWLDLNVERAPSSEIESCYFTVIVDDKMKPRDNYCVYNGDQGEKSFKIGSALESGKHTFKIYRQTQVDAGTTIKMRAIRLTGELLPAPAKNDLYIECIGDSITVGKGNLSFNGVTGTKAKHMDATKSYGYLTAQKLGADYSLVAVSAIGASVGWTSYNMQQVYPKLCYPKDKTTEYNFSRQPDVVVLALGTNDFQCHSQLGGSWDDANVQAGVKQGFADMLALVRQKNPEAKVVWIHGMMNNQVGHLIEEVISEAGGASRGLYTLHLYQNNAGATGHPNEAAHKDYATELTAKIRSIVPNATTTTKTTTTTAVTTTTSKLTTKTTTTPTTTKTTTTTPKITTKKTTKTTTTSPEVTTKKTTKKTTTKRTRKTFTLAPKTTTKRTTKTTATSPEITTKTTEETTTKKTTTSKRNDEKTTLEEKPLKTTTSKVVSSNSKTEEQTEVNEVIGSTADGEETLKTTTIASDTDVTDTNEDFPVVDSTTIDDDDETIADETLSADGTPEENTPKNNVIAKVIAIVAVAVAALGGGTFFIFKKRKNK